MFGRKHTPVRPVLPWTVPELVKSVLPPIFWPETPEMSPSVRSLFQPFLPVGTPSSNFAVEVVVVERVMAVVFPDPSDPVLSAFLGLWVIAVFPTAQDVISVEIRTVCPQFVCFSIIATPAFEQRQVGNRTFAIAVVPTHSTLWTLVALSARIRVAIFGVGIAFRFQASDTCPDAQSRAGYAARVSQLVMTIKLCTGSEG